ncbi:hypothetical protein NHH73_05170 [Oxalobacteraceae bacterium OTU3CINTB1]|nr:hypothetical protein NHH73_05170 [Oxalobacteraceae bacterium OTU3CINTB1]
MAAFLRRQPAGSPAKVIMKRLSILLALAATLSACGGGGGSGAASPSAPAPVVDTRPVVDIVPTVGDFYSYRLTHSSTTGDKPLPATPDYTHFFANGISKVQNDGSWVEIDIDSTQASRMESNIRPDGALTATKSAGCTSTYTPVVYGIPKDLTVGSEWTLLSTRSYVGDCSSGNEIKSSYKVTALETIVLSAGSFNTVKIVQTPTSMKYENFTETVESTVWWDAVTHQMVKYVVENIQTMNDGNKLRTVTSGELIGYASAKQGRKTLNIERFAGPWAGTYSGTYSGKCGGVVSLDGKLDADCGDGLFSVHGDIDVNGKGTFYLTVNGVKGASFSGAFESLFSIGGVWSAGAASGSWKLEHQ